MVASQEIQRRKCVVLGNAGVGKSSLLAKILNPAAGLRKGYEMTMLAEVPGAKAIPTAAGSPVHLFLFDIAGHVAYRESIPALIKDSHAYVIVYDVTDVASFQAAPSWQQAFQAVNGKSVPGALVGMKRDQELTRRVSQRHGEDMARKLGLAFFECSAAGTAEGDGGGAEREVEAPFRWIANASKEVGKP